MRIIVLLTVLTVAMVSLTAAQPQEMMKGHPGRPMERLERYKKIRMVEALNLDDETGVKLVTRYTKHRERLKDLEAERGEVVKKLEAMIDTKTQDAEYQKVFNELGETERKISEARKKYLEELGEILTKKQVAEYIVFERDFMKDVRNVIRDVQKERQRR